MGDEQGKQVFVPERIDEQIERYGQGAYEESAETNLVRDLRRAYREEDEEERTIARIHERLFAYMEARAQQGDDQRERVDKMNAQQRMVRKSAWKRPLSLLVAACITIVVVGSLVAVLQLARVGSRSGGDGDAAKKTPITKKTEPATVQRDATGIYLGVNNQMVKLDAQAKKVLWRYVVKTDPQDPPMFSQPLISPMPIVADGNVYFTAQNGRLYALSARTGRELWVHNFQAEVGNVYSVDKVIYTVIYGNTGGGSVHSLNATDGKEMRQYQGIGSIMGIIDGVIYQADGNMLTATRLVDGSQVWQAKINEKQVLNNEIYARGDVLYASSSHISEKQASEPQDSYVYTLDRQSGKITWQSPMMNGFVFHIAVGEDGKVYCGAQNHFVYAFDPQSNQQLWKYRTLAGYVYAAPIVLNGTIYVGQSSAGENGSNNDHLVALVASTGTPRWATSVTGYTGTGDMFPLGLHDGVIYMSTGEGLQGFSALNGKKVVTVDGKTLLGPGQTFPFIMRMTATIVP